jgi:hypothetical protein
MLAIAPAVTGSLVIKNDIKNVSSVPITLHVTAFIADLDLLTFMMATPYCLA